MLIRFQRLWILSVFLLFSSDGDASIINRSWWNPNRTAIIDRSLSDNGTSSYYRILPVDRTTFSLTRKVWLHQIDIAQIFTNSSNRKVLVESLPVKVKIIEKMIHDMRDKAIVFVGNVILNSTSEARIEFSPDITLTPSNMYEVRFFMPAMNFIYDEHLSVQEFVIKRQLWSSIRTSFYRTNIVDKPPFHNQHIDRISGGIVKRIHIKYSRF